jgi:hypothetical protein
LEKEEDEKEKMMENLILDKRKKEEESRSKALYEGKVSYMSEWCGSKENMPPENMDNFG